MRTLTATSLVVICRKSLSPFIRDIKGSVMPMGFMNSFGNKGAVSISFRIGKEKPLLFINNHLEAFVENRRARYEQMCKIFEEWVDPEQVDKNKRSRSVTDWLLCRAPKIESEQQRLLEDMK